ncbi:hypothetical protein [Rhodococcoides fascians]|uniref:hypothetical protein n=1 Tax=Rhodococcoides fascians TaxID=1828 RepID=UPI0037B85B9A
MQNAAQQMQEEWFDGTEWMLTQGHSFEGPVSAMKQALTAECTRRGLTVVENDVMGNLIVFLAKVKKSE